jgi:hypothetical protein
MLAGNILPVRPNRFGFHPVSAKHRAYRKYAVQLDNSILAG